MSGEQVERAKDGSAGTDGEGAGDWHAIPADDALDALEADSEGLSEEEAASRLERYGPNALSVRKTRGPLRRLIDQFNNLLIQVLIGAAVVTALLEHWIDTAVIMAVVIVNAAIGFVQEGKAERALQAIRHMLAPQAAVLRRGRRVSVPASDLAPGDIVLLEPGDRVPADLRLLRARNLRIEEAVLTGESVPVEKHVEPVGRDAPLGDRICMAYSGTLVTNGQATALVVATGDATEIGRISQLLGEVEQLTTPLVRQMARFSRWLTGAILLFAVALFGFGMLIRDVAPAEMFMVLVGLAVAAIPEGLPAILTVTLAIGVQRMAGRNAIIRRLPAVETLGAVSVICSDKTGTLTRNEMTVRTVALADRTIQVSGVGYEPVGELTADEQTVEVAEGSPLHNLALAALLCNDARLDRDDSGWRIEGDPMEAALLALGAKAGLDLVEEPRRRRRTDHIPFDAEHRFMATLNHGPEGSGAIFVKGAPERILEMCAAQAGEAGEAPLDRDRWSSLVDEIAAEGQRVLAVAFKPAADGQKRLDAPDVESELTFLGLLGLIDPPREEAIAAVADCRAAGIRVKMITGDHAVTARAIAAQLGLANHDEVVTGADLDGMSDAEIEDAASRVDVFARTSPEHKLKLVSALQARDRIVAMTGDGVNDAPALKRADVGIAMGRKGTEAAKEASEMVLADDNFASIAAAVREGRTVYDNLKKAIIFLLPVNGGETLAIIVAILLGYALPISPLQILWVNMVSSVALAMALAFEPTEPDAMKRPPRPPREPILSAFLVWRVVLVSVLFLIGIYGAFEWVIAHGGDEALARTYAVNALVVMEVFYLFSVRFLRTPSFTWRGMLGTRAVLIAIGVVTVFQFLFTYAPPMQALFDTRPVDLLHGPFIVGVGAALLVLLELEKAVLRWMAESGAGGKDRDEEALQ